MVPCSDDNSRAIETTVVRPIDGNVEKKIEVRSRGEPGFRFSDLPSTVAATYHPSRKSLGFGTVAHFIVT